MSNFRTKIKRYHFNVRRRRGRAGVQACVYSGPSGPVGSHATSVAARPTGRSNSVTRSRPRAGDPFGRPKRAGRVRPARGVRGSAGAASVPTDTRSRAPATGRRRPPARPGSPRRSPPPRSRPAGAGAPGRRRTAPSVREHRSTRWSVPSGRGPRAR